MFSDRHLTLSRLKLKNYLMDLLTAVIIPTELLSPEIITANSSLPIDSI